jgi:hypothetical protein
MLLEVPKNCSLILVIEVALDFCTKLTFQFRRTPMFSGVTHSTNVHSLALEGGHGVVYF